MIYQTEAEANEACIEWQSRLRLADWNVRVLLSKPDDLKEGCQATIIMVITRKEATLLLMDHRYYQDDQVWPQDMEEALVHELLHIYTNAMGYAAYGSGEKPMLYEIAEEQLIQSLATSLVALKRGER